MLSKNILYNSPPYTSKNTNEPSSKNQPSKNPLNRPEVKITSNNWPHPSAKNTFYFFLLKTKELLAAVIVMRLRCCTHWIGIIPFFKVDFLIANPSVHVALSSYCKISARQADWIILWLKKQTYIHIQTQGNKDRERKEAGLEERLSHKTTQPQDTQLHTHSWHNSPAVFSD